MSISVVNSHSKLQPLVPQKWRTRWSGLTLVGTAIIWGLGAGGEGRERFYSFRPLPLMQVDDVPPHSTYYNYAHEQENQHTNHNVFELGTENDSVLEL